MPSLCRWQPSASSSSHCLYSDRRLIFMSSFWDWSGRAMASATTLFNYTDESLRKVTDIRRNPPRLTAGEPQMRIHHEHPRQGNCGLGGEFGGCERPPS